MVETLIDEKSSNGEILKTAVATAAIVVVSVYIKRAIFRSIGRAALRELDRIEEGY